jgi:predicted transcriptional regulator YheO
VQHRRYLESLRPIADAVSATFGDICEVVIHDFSSLDNSIIHIAGSVTGRHVGGPLTDLGLAILRQDQVPDCLINYTTYTQDGRRLRSSTIFAKDESGVPFGALCINVDITHFLAIEPIIMRLTHNDRNGEVLSKVHEDFPDTPEAAINRIFDKAVFEMGKPVSAMSRHEKIELVHRLDQAGMFSLRRAVDTAAALLGTSRGTVYGYLKRPVEAGKA